MLVFAKRVHERGANLLCRVVVCETRVREGVGEVGGGEFSVAPLPSPRLLWWWW